MRRDSRVRVVVQRLLTESPKTVDELMGRSGYSRTSIAEALRLIPHKETSERGLLGGRHAIRYALESLESDK